MQHICEPELIDLLKLKNEKAFNYLYDNYAAALMGVILRRVKCQSAAEEILQSVFLKIWRHIALYSPEKSSLYTWIHTIASHESIDYVRSKEAKNRKQTSLIGEMKLNGSFIEQGLVRYDFERSLSRLPRNERVIIELFYIGYTCKEIAALRQMPEGSVKTKMRYAYRKLRAILS